jgi:hypothetical protein
MTTQVFSLRHERRAATDRGQWTCFFSGRIRAIGTRDGMAARIDPDHSNQQSGRRGAQNTRRPGT